MAANQIEYSMLEQRSVIKFTEECVMCTEKYLLIKNVYKMGKLFKDGRKSIQDGDKPGRPIMARSPEMVVSINSLFVADKRRFLNKMKFLYNIQILTMETITQLEFRSGSS